MLKIDEDKKNLQVTDSVNSTHLRLELKITKNALMCALQVQQETSHHQAKKPTYSFTSFLRGLYFIIHRHMKRLSSPNQNG